jgi:hypothetical protein
MKREDGTVLLILVGQDATIERITAILDLNCSKLWRHGAK